MSYSGNGAMLGGFFADISKQNAAEALAEATIDHIDNAVFRDMYMDTMNEALDHGVDYLNKFDEDSDYLKENLEDAILGIGDVDDMDFSDVEEACADCEPAIQNCISKVPEGNPADAGTYFSLVNKVNAEGDPEARKAIKEQMDLIEAIIPDTIIVAEDATAPIKNELNFSNNREKCPEHYNPRKKNGVTNSDGNHIVQPEVYSDEVTKEALELDDVLEDDYFEVDEGFNETLAQLQAQRNNPDVSTPQGRLAAKVASAQSDYPKFQNNVNSGMDINKARADWSKNINSTNKVMAGFQAASNSSSNNQTPPANTNPKP